MLRELPNSLFVGVGSSQPGHPHVIAISDGPIQYITALLHQVDFQIAIIPVLRAKHQGSNELQGGLAALVVRVARCKATRISGTVVHDQSHFAGTERQKL